MHSHQRFLANFLLVPLQAVASFITAGRASQDGTRRRLSYSLSRFLQHSSSKLSTFNSMPQPIEVCGS